MYRGPRFSIMKVLLALSVSIFLVGCAGVRTKHSGNLTSFLIVQLKDLEAKVLQANGLPAINTNWEFLKDKYGFVISVEGNNFAEVDALLQKIYGIPIVSRGTNVLDANPTRHFRVPGVPPAGFRVLAYSLTDTGVLIVCLKNNAEW